MIKNIAFTLMMLSVVLIHAQNKPAATSPSTAPKPKLVVGIVIDQMRWDYLYRYAEKYGQTGFKRLQKGYNCENTHIPYIPTYTAPGHTCIYTGSVPALHGIVGNEWYDRSRKKHVYCTEDTSCHTIGATGDAGQMSPRNMLTTTITDELRLASNFRSKVIGIALKDRGSILPAGHAANKAYWFDGRSGCWISSSYYGDTLPRWATEFNAKKLPAKYLAENWATLLPIGQYTESSMDNEPYESAFKKETKPTFPHQTSEMMDKNVDAIRATPRGNTLTFDFAKAAIEGEQLGKGSATDFLAVSFSSTDYIGHQFGPNSVEIEDCYIRLDREMGDFLSYLDRTIGAGNYLIFLTADHGAAHAVGFNQEHHLPSENMEDKAFVDSSNSHLKNVLHGDSIIEAYTNLQFYLKDHSAGSETKDVPGIKNTLLNTSVWDNNATVKLAIDLRNINAEPLPVSVKERIINGYNPKRSGDIQIIYEPAVMEDKAKGTTHGTMYNYDTHIPLLWYGWGIRGGYDYSATNMTDIAATLAAILHIQEPNGCVGKPIEGLLKK